MGERFMDEEITKSNVTREGFAKAVEARQKGKKIEKEAEQKAA
jgi:hypothetical protein